MEKTTDPNKKICDKPSSETTIQKLVCTPNLENDESEVFKVPKFAPK